MPRFARPHAEARHVLSHSSHHRRPDHRQPRLLPDHLARSGREEMIAALGQAGVRAIVPGPDQTKYGAVETHQEARLCADLFKAHRDAIAGVIVSLRLRRRARHRRHAAPRRTRRARPRPGDTRHGRPDDHPGSPRQLLRQDVGLQQPRAVTASPTPLTTLHTEAPDSTRSAATSRGSSASARSRAGSRTCASAPSGRGRRRSTRCATARNCSRRAASRSRRRSLEILGRVERLKDDDPSVAAKLAAIKAYAPVGATPAPALLSRRSSAP